MVKKLTKILLAIPVFLLAGCLGSTGYSYSSYDEYLLNMSHYDSIYEYNVNPYYSRFYTEEFYWTNPYYKFDWWTYYDYKFQPYSFKKHWFEYSYPLYDWEY